MGGGDVLGLGWVQSSIGDGVRSSSATTYLEAAKSRPNLDVLVGHQVTKLAPVGWPIGGKPSFRQVHFAAGPSGTFRSIVDYLGAEQQL